MQNTQEEFISHRKDPVNLAAGERSVEEEPDLDILLAGSNLFPQHLGQQHQVVVVNPHQVSILHIFCNSLREKAIGLLVCFPGRLVERDFTGMIVE